MKRSYWFFAAFIFFASWCVGCRTSKVIETREVIKKDTVFIDTSKTVILPLEKKVIIEQLCDSVTGLPSDISVASSSGMSALKVEIKDNRLEASINIDSIKQVAIREFRSSLSSEVDKKEETIIVTKVPKWAWWSLLMNGIVLLYWGYRLKAGGKVSGLSRLWKRLSSKL